MKSLEIFDVTQEEIDAVFKLMSIILAIGNIRIEKGEDNHAPCTIVEDEYTKAVTNLTGMDHKSIELYFTHKEMLIQGEITHKQIMKKECEIRKDIIAKSIYQALFDWLVDKQKDLTDIDITKPYESIGILDISGFEVLPVNSLEQLGINYGNEKAQHLFTTSYFEEEKSLFEKEGLARYIMNFSPETNEDIIDLIDKPKNKPPGIFQILQQVSKTKRSDGSFLVEMESNFKNTHLFSKNKLSKDKFTVHHSCYPVEYQNTDFVEKSKDEVPISFFQNIKKTQPDVGAILSVTITKFKDPSKMYDY